MQAVRRNWGDVHVYSTDEYGYREINFDVSNDSGKSPRKTALYTFKFQGHYLQKLLATNRDIDSIRELANAIAKLGWVYVNGQFCYGTPCT